MSYNKTNNKTNGCFCKVCFDAGKTEDVYKSHYVRSNPGPTGVVTCPLLLSTECKYCHKTGHTVKFCGVLKNKQKNDRRSTFLEKETKNPSTTSTSITNQNRFDVLGEDGGEQCVVFTPREPMLTGWAKVVASRPPAQPTRVTAAPSIIPVAVAQCAGVEALEAPLNTVKKVLSWADYPSDSEDEEDDCW